MARRRRVVITGLGVVAPNGIGKDAFWKNLIAGKSAVDYITAFDASPYPCRVAAEVRDFRPQEFMHPRRTRHRGRFSQFAVAAAKLAVADAGLALKDEDPRRILACIGTSANGVGDICEEIYTGFERDGVNGIPQTSSIEYPAHAPVSHLSIELGLSGQAMTLASACATGLDTVQWAQARIAAGVADLAFAGSTDAPVSRLSFATLCASGWLSKFDDPPTRASRPYDRRRDGLVLGEGAVIVILEDLDHALSRGATIYAEVLGFGTGNEGGLGARVDASELALTQAIQSAIQQAAISSDNIDYVNAHGNGLADFDLVETRAFKRALGKRVYNIPISSVKSMIGHAMGAASSFQVAAACLVLQHSIIPPTLNLDTPDPECDLDYVPTRSRTARVRTLLVNASSMGGTHSALILGHLR